MKDSEQIYKAAKFYVECYDQYLKMDAWLLTHTNDEAKPLEGRVKDIITQANNALINLVNSCKMEQ